MKKWFLKAALALGVGAFTGTAWAAGQPPNTNNVAITNGNPKIQFAEQSYDFGRVIQGTVVKHDFIFTNTGDATLKIDGVKPGCGCTTVGDWTHEVEPGKTGAISLQFASGGYSTPVIKNTTVTCNDKDQSFLTLVLRGIVIKAFDLSQEFVAFTIGPDADGKTNAVIHITNNLDDPMTLTNPTSALPCFTAEIKTNTPGKSFDLIIKSVPPFQPGQNQSVITVQSATGNLSTPINTIALANAQTPFEIHPDKFEVPEGTLTSNVTVTVYVRNGATRPVTLSDPSVNAKGAEASIEVTQPGVMSKVTLNVPAGFEPPAGLPLFVDVKTDHPWQQLLHIPIIRTAAPPATAAQTNSTPGR